MIPDYYKILDVSSEASREEVSKAYRRQAKRYHPDRNDDPNAHQLFIAVHEAYEVLRDGDRRDAYNERYQACYKNDAEPEHNDEYYEQAFALAAEQGRAEGERYAADYKLFSKKVLRGAAGVLITELFLPIIFREINSIGLLLGLIALIAGGYLTFRGLNALSFVQIGCGLLITAIGYLILRHEMRKIVEEQE